MQSVLHIPTLIGLLDDDDVWLQVAQDLMTQGDNISEELRIFCSSNKHNLTTVQTERLEYVLQRINFNKLLHNYQNWVKQTTPPLLDALVYLAAYIYPTLDPADAAITNRIQDICEDVEVRITVNMTTPERLTKLNEVFFSVYGFQIADGFENQHFAINYALGYKKASSTLLTLLYCTIAQRLGLPVYPILTDAFLLLGGLNKPTNSKAGLYGQPILANTNKWHWGKVDYFIDPADKGVLISNNLYSKLLSQCNLGQSDNYYRPCSAVQAFHYLLLQYHHALILRNNDLNAQEIQGFIDLLEKNF